MAEKAKRQQEYFQRRSCSKASTANKSQSLSEGAALKAQVDSCLLAHSFLVKAANFASLHKRTANPVFAFSFEIQLRSSAMQSSRRSQHAHSRLRTQNQNLNPNQFLSVEHRICMVCVHSFHSKQYMLKGI